MRGVPVDRLVAGRDVVGVEALGGSATVQRIEVPGRVLIERATERLLKAWRIGEREFTRPPHILERVAAG